MALLHVTENAGVAQMLEASLIAMHMSQTGCRNEKHGGECPSSCALEPFHFVYIVGARADCMKRIRWQHPMQNSQIKLFQRWLPWCVGASEKMTLIGLLNLITYVAFTTGKDKTWWFWKPNLCPLYMVWSNWIKLFGYQHVGHTWILQAYAPLCSLCFIYTLCWKVLEINLHIFICKICLYIYTKTLIFIYLFIHSFICLYSYINLSCKAWVIDAYVPACAFHCWLRSLAETSSSRRVSPVWRPVLSNSWAEWIQKTVKEIAMPYFVNTASHCQFQFPRWIWTARRISHMSKCQLGLRTWSSMISWSI